MSERKQHKAWPVPVTTSKPSRDRQGRAELAGGAHSDNPMRMEKGEVTMTNWKRALVFSSLGAGALLLLTGRRPAGIAVATVGLAVLASEYPEKFETIWEHGPDYVSRGVQIFQTLTQIAERFAEQAQHRGIPGAWHEVREEYGR
jgi:glycerol-3-phosphate cytidylyltransferase-like family protein